MELEQSQSGLRRKYRNMTTARGYTDRIRLFPNGKGGQFKEIVVLSDCLNLNCFDLYCKGCKPITQTAAKKLLKAELEKRGLTFTKVTSRLDHGRSHRSQAVVIAVHGFKPPADQQPTRWNPGAWQQLFEFADSHGFLTEHETDAERAQKRLKKRSCLAVRRRREQTQLTLRKRSTRRT